MCAHGMLFPGDSPKPFPALEAPWGGGERTGVDGFLCGVRTPVSAGKGWHSGRVGGFDVAPGSTSPRVLQVLL